MVNESPKKNKTRAPSVAEEAARTLALYVVHSYAYDDEHRGAGAWGLAYTLYRHTGERARRDRESLLVGKLLLRELDERIERTGAYVPAGREEQSARARAAAEAFRAKVREEMAKIEAQAKPTEAA